MWNSLQISINSNEPGRAKTKPDSKKVAHCCSTPMNLLDVPEWLNSARRSKIRPRSCFQPRNILSCMWNCYSRPMNDRDPSRLNSLIISSSLNQSSLDRRWPFLRARAISHTKALCLCDKTWKTRSIWACEPSRPWLCHSLTHGDCLCVIANDAKLEN